MTSKTWTSGTVIDSPWLQDVNDSTYGPTAPLTTLRGQLSNTSLTTDGDARIGVLQPFTGAVARTQHQKNSENLSVFDFGCVGNGLVDDAANLQKFLDAGGCTFPGPDYTFLLGSKVLLSKDKVNLNGNGSTIKHSATYTSGGTNTLVAFQVSADDVTIRNFIFDGSAGVTQSVYNSFIAVVSGAERTTTYGNYYRNLVTGAGAQAAVMFLTGSSDGISGLERFNTCPGGVFSQAARTCITNNISIEPSDVSFALNGVNCVGASVTHNKIFKTSGACSAHIAAEEGANRWVISGNYIRGVQDGAGISALNVSVFTVVLGGIISDNVIDGGNLVGPSPSVGIAWTVNYTNVDCHDNIVRNLPTGNSNSRGAIISSTNSKFHDNDIDCSTNTYGAVVSIVVGAGTLDIKDNKINATGNSRAYLFSSGDNASNRIAFWGGEIIGGTEGINANLNSPTNVDLWIINHGTFTSTTPLVLATAITAWADWQTYFNAGAKEYPHSIKTLQRTIMYGATVPAAGSGINGGRVMAQSPLVGTPKGWIKAAGVWVSEGNL